MLCRKCKSEFPDDYAFCPYCGTKQLSSNKKGKPRQRGNGTGTVYKRGKTWTVKVTTGKKDGKLIRKTKGGFKTKNEALNYIPTLRNERSKKSVTLYDLWQTYEKTRFKKLSKSKQTHYKTAYNRLEDILYYDISTLLIEDLQDTVDDKAPTFYPARDMKTVLSGLYNIAVAQQEAITNLAHYIVLPELTETSPEPFNENEILAFWKGWNGGIKMCGYILLMIHSGMMPGELFKVSKNMIDFQSQTITGAGLKTKKRKETPIVLADAIIPVVQKLCDLSESLMLLDISREKFYEEYKNTVQECGCRPLRPYSCRHTTATALALLNTSTMIIKEVMRHSKITTTQKYVHIDTNPMLEAVNNIK